jgi:hypothetical protein
VRYLSREERQAYLVDIDDEGRLCWNKNKERIDTTIKYTDSKHGMGIHSYVACKANLTLGIVPTDDPTAHSDETRHGDDQTLRRTSSVSSSATSISSTMSDEAKRYANTSVDAQGRVYNNRISPAVILNRLLRKTVRKNTWIFVADTSFRLYVGIKQSGAFQHSSFLHGARVSAAGLIKINNGKLKSLSPLSGHYRPSAEHFRQFVRSLKEAGCDMSGISISKSYAVLLGLEAYGSIRKGKRRAESKMKGTAEKARVRSKDEEGKNKDEEGKSKDEEGKSKDEEGKSKDEDGGQLGECLGGDRGAGRGYGSSASAAETLVPTETKVSVDRKLIKEEKEKKTENGLAPRIMRKRGFS